MLIFKTKKKQYFSSTLQSLQIIEVLYGTYMATEVAYYTYIYSKVEKEHYQKVSSHTRAAIMAGRFIAAVISQVLVGLDWMDYRELNYISLAAQVLATVWAVSLPGVKTSVYFHRNRPTETSNLVKAAATSNGGVVLGASTDNAVVEVVAATDKSAGGMGAMVLLWSHFRSSYKKRKVREWSLWYAMGMCGYLQIITYVQMIWNAIREDATLWNGAVEAGLTLLSALVALLAGYLHNGFFNSRRSIIVLIALCMFEAIAIYTISNTTILAVSYAAYLVFGVLYAFTITVASAEVAKELDDDSFGLIFGFNTFLALALQTIITFLFVSGSVFQLDIFQQFLAYCIFFVVLGVIYTIALAYDMFQSLRAVQEKRSGD